MNSGRGLAMAMIQTRREFLTALSLAGAAGVARAPQVLAAEGALETTSVRFLKGGPATCIALVFAAEELLRAEGFIDIRYDETSAANLSKAIASGQADFSMGLALNHVEAIDAGLPITVVAGVHIGCYELFAKESIRSITGLKGKTVGLKASPRDLLTLIAAQIGLDAVKDIHLVSGADALELFAEGKIDGFLGFPP